MTPEEIAAMNASLKDPPVRWNDVDRGLTAIRRYLSSLGWEDPAMDDAYEALDALEAALDRVSKESGS